MKTKFASPERSTPQEIEQTNRTIIHSDVFKRALNDFPEIVLILDKNRQAVYANQELLRLLDVKTDQEILGKRPGEIFQCIHAFDEPAGCGTSEFCKDCNAVKAILMSHTGKIDSEECRITVRTPSGSPASLDLRVWAIPVTINESVFTFFVIRDIQDEKRRQILEKVFFHDLLNDTNALKGYSENLREGLSLPNKETLGSIIRVTQRVIDTILEQRDLLAAESGAYSLVMDNISVRNLLCDLVLFYENSPIAAEKDLDLQCSLPNPMIRSDYSLLWRILSNLIKNALEATAAGGTVTLGYKEEEEGKKVFSVNNPGVMTDEVRHQLFQRSFSTRGRGRGIGTYSVRLFTEQYLHGKVWFESGEKNGTTFFVALQ